MKKIVTFLLIVIIIIGLFYSISASQSISVNDYIKDKFPSIFSFYLSFLEDLDSYEKEFIDLLEKLPEEEQEYYAKEVYKNGFSPELLKEIKDGKKVPVPTSNHLINILPQEKPVENLPSLIKRIKPSTIIIFVYDDKGEFLKLGSGFFISQNGDVITNYHVIQGASSAEIKTADGKTYPITYILAGDEQSDIIRLSVDIPSQDVYPLSLSQTIPEVGERIIVYGSPLGLENTVSDGIVSAIRDIPDYGRIIQITAPISPGSSGSPVLNLQGEVIGIASFQMIEGQNLNFAIPSEKIASLILTEKNKISIPEKDFGQENKTKKESDYDQTYQKALYFMDKKEYEKALPYLEIAIKTDILSLKENVYIDIGFCYGELGNYIKTIEACKQAIRINPNRAGTYYNLGLSYYNLNLYKESIEAFKQAIRINPDADTYNFLGVNYGELGLYKEAIEAYKQAIRIDPNEAIFYCNLGLNFGKFGLYKESIEAFKQAIRIDPDYPYAHRGLGTSYLLIGDKSSALDEYKILKELDINLANELFDLIY
jgi:S1-C subfamily serine protease/Tfp pilus assembly protein PilF